MRRQPFLVTVEVGNENITPPVSRVDEEQEKKMNDDPGQPGKSNCPALLRPSGPSGISYYSFSHAKR